MKVDVTVKKEARHIVGVVQRYVVSHGDLLASLAAS